MLDAHQPFVSVVTPVHNGAKYLSECIESVIGQTYTNWEYILLDNFSTDESSEIARKYAQQDCRIRCYRTEKFLGVVESHNSALSHISSESKYCKIVHADDWLFPECVTQMVNLGEQHPEAGVVGAYGLKGVRVVWDELPYPSTVVSGREVCRRSLLGGFYVFGSPTSLMIRADYIRKAGKFYEGNEFYVRAMDEEVCFKILQTADFGFVHQVLTYTREHENSLSAMGADLNEGLPSILTILTKYGPLYLNDGEYKLRYKHLMGRYHRFLGWSLLRRKDKQFWDYHKRALACLGHRLSICGLLRGLFLESLDIVLNPKALISKAVGRA